MTEKRRQNGYCGCSLKKLLVIHIGSKAPKSHLQLPEVPRDDISPL
jgi:hypothetical protein